MYSTSTCCEFVAGLQNAVEQDLAFNGSTTFCHVEMLYDLLAFDVQQVHNKSK